jgi:uncharacterized protein (TIGR01244 family)
MEEVKMKLIRLISLPVLLLVAAPLPAADWTELSEGIRASDTVLVGGQPSADVLREAAAAGIKVVVNFRGESEDPGFDEEAVAAGLGLTYLRVPVAGAQGLTPENVYLFDAVLDQVGRQPALMHCASGNRVGALHALHAARFGGKDPETAIAIGKAHGLTSLEGEVRKRLEP